MKNKPNDDIQSSQMPINEPFHKKTWFIVLMLIFIPPVGIILAWVHKKFTTPIRILVSVLLGLYTLFWILIFFVAITTDTSKIQKPTIVQTQNILIDTELKTESVMNGAGTEAIGTYALINITKEALKNVTHDQFKTFTDTIIQGSKHNWVSIRCDDDTGIIFTGSNIHSPVYGKLNTEGKLEETIGSIVLKDGTYIYEPKEAAPISEPDPVLAQTNDATIGQKNALNKAKQYLDYSAFSYTGLIKQLEYEKFSTEDATYAVDNCKANWNQQAAKKAKEYLEYNSFSRDGLIQQLTYEEFTPEQVEFGVAAVGY